MKLRLFLITLFVIMFSFVFVACDEGATAKPAHYGAVEATCATDGHIEFYTLNGKFYKDEACENEITENDVIVKATGKHTYTDYVTTTPATESTKGEETHHCTVCGKVETREIAVKEHEHVLIKHAAVNSTCTIKGTIEYYECYKCNAKFSDAAGTTEITNVEAELAAHDLVETAEVKATCAAEGCKAYYTCQTCAKVFADKDAKTETTIEACATKALAHTVVEHKAVPATCTTAGTDAYYECSVCKGLFTDKACTNKILEAPVVTALGHTPKYVAAVDAKCGVKGNIAYYTCTVCNKKYSDSALTQEITNVEVAALAHNLVHHDAIATTCKTDGQVEYYECTLCKGLYADAEAKTALTKAELVVKTTGHDLVHHAAVEGNCTTKSVKEYWTCNVCSKVYADAEAKVLTTVAVLTGGYGDHVIEHHAAVEAGCGVAGNKEYWTCTACHAVATDAALVNKTTLEAVTIVAVPHQLVEVAEVPAECEKTGVAKHYECSVCGNKYMDANGTIEATNALLITKAKGHNCVLVDYEAPTLENPGHVAYYACQDCQNLYKDAKGYEKATNIEVPVLTDPIWTMVTINPTLAKGGYDLYRADGYKDVKINFTEAVANPFNAEATYNIYEVFSYYAWNSCKLTLNADGIGFASAYPGRGCTEVIINDKATGKATIRLYNLKSVTKEVAEEIFDNGGYVCTSTYTVLEETWDFEEEVETTSYYVINYDSYTDYAAYICADGTIIRAKSDTLISPLIYTYAAQTSATLKGSKWGACAAIQLATAEGVTNAFIENEVVYFNVSFADGDGKAVAANQAKNQSYLNVLDEAGNIITAYVNDGKELVKVDGYQGTYTNRLGDITLDGCGNIVFQGKDGTYDIENMIVIADGMTYDIVLNRETMTYEFNEKLVKVAYHVGNGNGAYNKMVPYSLAYTLDVLPNTATLKFMGWYTDEACTKEVILEADGTYMPLEDIQLFAKWALRVDLTLVNVKPGDDSTFVYGVGEYLVESKLPYYGTEKIWLDEWKVFRGWYLEETFDTIIPASAEITEEYANTTITLYGKWEALPDYYGTFNGKNVYNSTSGTGTTDKTFTIDEDGNITGKYTAKVTGYDPTTGIITVGSDTIYFDKATGTIATYYNKLKAPTDLGDIDLYARNATKINYSFAFRYAPYTTTTSYPVRLVEFAIGEETELVLWYNGTIIEVGALTDSFGNAVTMADLTKYNSTINTLIVKDTNGIEIYNVGDPEKALTKCNTTQQALDGIQGTYSCYTYTYKFDGLGKCYDNDEYFGAYFKYEDVWYLFLEDNGNNVATFKLEFDGSTVNGSDATCTYSLTKEFGSEAKTIEPYYFIEYELDTLENTTDKVFRGYKDSDTGDTIEDNKVTFIPGSDENHNNIEAIWLDKATLTINYNDGATENTVIEYAVGETATVERPVYDKHAFVKWIDNDFEEWTSGTAMTGDLTIKAQWTDAPIYNQNYQFVIVNLKDAKSGLINFDDRLADCNIDPYGECAKVTSYPYYGYSVKVITTYNNVNEPFISVKVTFTNGTKVETKLGYCFRDTGLIILRGPNDDSSGANGYLLLVPEKASTAKTHLTGSYDKNGKCFAIQYTLNAGTDQEVVDTAYYFNGFASSGKYYFKSIFDENITYSANDLYNTVGFAVYTSNNELNFVLSYDKETDKVNFTNPLDNNVGEFTDNDGNKYILDGISTARYIESGKEPVEFKYYIIDDTHIEFLLGDESYSGEITKANKTIVLTSITVKVTKKTDGADDKESYVAKYSIFDIAEEIANYNKNSFMHICTGITSNLYEGTKTEGEIVINAEAEFDFITAEKVTLTVKYETGDQNYYFAKGATIAFDYPTGVVNGKIITGWKLGDDEYTFGVINENMTITPVYKTVHALYGSYVGFEIYNNNSYVISNKTMAVDVDGKVSSISRYSLQYYSFEYNETAGTYSYTYKKSFVDATNKIIAISDTYNTSNGLAYDVWLFFQATSVTCSSNDCSIKDSRNTRFIKVTLNGTDAVNILIWNDVVYYNVSFTNDVTTATAGAATGFSVLNAGGEVIVTY